MPISTRAHDSLKQRWRRARQSASIQPDPGDLPGSGQPANAPALKHLLAALLDENSRLVDQLRATMRDLRASEQSAEKLRAEISRLRAKG